MIKQINETKSSKIHRVFVAIDSDIEWLKFLMARKHCFSTIKMARETMEHLGRKKQTQLTS